MKPYLWILAAPLLATAQVATVDLAAPTLGYVFDHKARGLRAVEGVPGAAAIGSKLHLGTEFEEITWAPNRRSAIGAVGGWLFLLRLDGASGAAEPLDIESGRVFWSPGSETIAILRGSNVEVRNGFRAGPVFETGAGAELSRVAVSDDGSVIAALSREGGLWILNAEGSRQELGGGWADVVFERQSHRLLALNRSGNAVSQFDKVGSGEPATTLLDEASGLRDPYALALSADEGRMVVLNGDGSALWWERTGGALYRQNLGDADASGLWRMQGNAVFQLSRDSAGSIWLLDGDSESPRLTVLERREVE